MGLHLWKTLWAIWTMLACGAAGLVFGAGALATGKGALAGTAFLAFFGFPALCAALRLLPLRMRGRFRFLQVRPGTILAVLVRFLSYFLCAVSFGSLYAIFTVDLPSPDGLFYALFPLVVLALAGAAYFTWTHETLMFPSEEQALRP